MILILIQISDPHLPPSPPLGARVRTAGGGVGSVPGVDDSRGESSYSRWQAAGQLATLSQPPVLANWKRIQNTPSVSCTLPELFFLLVPYFDKVELCEKSVLNYNGRDSWGVFSGKRGRGGDV